MSLDWNDVARVRTLLGTEREAGLRSLFDPSSEAHRANAIEGAIESVRRSALFAGQADDFLDEDGPDDDE
jgi:hypothetical protein